MVSIGLTFSYFVLIYSLCTYFRQEMHEQIVRLSGLFATFVLAYILRFFYQLGRGTEIYIHMIPSLFARWTIILGLPLIWDISSIISILILHYKSFRPAK